MFKLNHESYVKFLESVQELERVLLEELDNQQEIEGRVQNIWTGNKALETKEMIYYSLTEGNHDKAKKYTQGMSRIMSEYLIPIRQLMARREQIGEQLKQDDYKEPDLSYFVEKELIINYDYISSVDADCEGALSYGLSAANIVRQMLSKAAECAGEYLDLSGIEDLIDKGEKKIRRLENYQYEFDLFAQKMSDLESSISTDLSTVMRETGDEVTADKCMELVVSDSEQRVQEMEDRSENFDDRLEDILSRPAKTLTDADLE